MKHISKTALLFGALAMLVSTVPVQAMGDIGPEVAQKQGFFAKWTQKAKSLRLDALRKELDKHWKKFMTCIKGDKGCPRSLVWTIRGILASIIALVVVGTPVVVGVAAEKYGPTKGWVGKTREAAERTAWKTPGSLFPAREDRPAPEVGEEPTGQRTKRSRRLPVEMPMTEEEEVVEVIGVPTTTY